MEDVASWRAQWYDKWKKLIPKLGRVRLMWGLDAYFEQLYQEAIARHAEESSQETREERKERLRTGLRKAIGAFTKVENTAAPELLERVDCGDYIRERVKLSATPGLSFGAYVLVPKDLSDKGAGVLAVHGHGYGSREITGMLLDGSDDPNVEKPGIHQHFALQLVRRGMVVIAPDVIGFGERRLAADQVGTGNSCYPIATQLLLHGKTLTGLRTTELLSALDYLARRAEVNESRLGAMGFSGGALLSFMCATLDERIRATVLTGFPNTFKDSIMSIHHCIDNYTPGMLALAELPEWISLLAPRALFVESGVSDPIFPIAGTLKAIAEIEKAYAIGGSGERFESDLFPGSHEISGRKAYDWLKHSLS